MDVFDELSAGGIAVVIAVGIGAVIAMVSIGEIVKAESLKQFRALGTDVVTVRLRQGDASRSLSHAEVAGMADTIPEIAAVAPWTSDNAEVLYRGAMASRGQLLDVTKAFVPLQRLDVVEGRFVSDLDGSRTFCVLGSTAAQLVREVGARQLVGAWVRIEGRLFTVVGVLGPNPSSAQSAGTDDAVLLPIGDTIRMGTRSIARSRACGTARMRSPPRARDGVLPPRGRRASIWKS